MRVQPPIDIKLRDRLVDSVWATPLSLAATRRIMSFPRPTEMFQFGRCPLACLSLFSREYHPLPGDGLPHSEIVGSRCGCSLPDAFRSFPRPSSARDAKASTACLNFLLLCSPVASTAHSLRLQCSRHPNLSSAPHPLGREHLASRSGPVCIRNLSLPQTRDSSCRLFNC
jgi:hypothetical protein